MITANGARELQEDLGRQLKEAHIHVRGAALSGESYTTYYPSGSHPTKEFFRHLEDNGYKVSTEDRPHGKTITISWENK